MMLCRYFKKLYAKFNPVIITDTSIFYDIASGTIKPEIFSEQKLAATLMTLHEMSSSYKIISKLEEVKAAAEVINKNAVIVTADAFDFAVKRINEKFKIDPLKSKVVMDSYKLLLNPETKIIIDKVAAKKMVDEYKAPFKNQVESLNNKLTTRTKPKQMIKI